MDYYIDTEFLEGTQKNNFPLSLFKKETKPTIDLISIGIVDEEGREYYAISNEFNLKEAWNRHDLKVNKHFPTGPEYIKVYWIRENVLRPIFDELKMKEYGGSIVRNEFTYNGLKELIKEFGKSNKQIAEEIKEFCLVKIYDSKGRDLIDVIEPTFYGYFADYDWVVFCWMFGKMIDLPEGFPFYCRDLKQESDRIYNLKKQEYEEIGRNFILEMKNHLYYPKQTNEHNALDDAKWNKELHIFLKDLKNGRV